MFIVYDIETTGLSRHADDVIQFSYLAFDDKNRCYKHDTLYFYYEGMSWSEEAYNVHHISIDFLKQYAGDFKKNLIKMFTVLSDANVVGFNNEKFDNPFCITWLRRMGMGDVLIADSMDCMKCASPVSGSARISLIKLCEKMGLTPDVIKMYQSIYYGTQTQAHDADYDVTATTLLALQFMKRGYYTFDYVETRDAIDVDPAYAATAGIKLTDDFGFYAQDAYGNKVMFVRDKSKFDNVSDIAPIVNVESVSKDGFEKNGMIFHYKYNLLYVTLPAMGNIDAQCTEKNLKGLVQRLS